MKMPAKKFIQKLFSSHSEITEKTKPVHPVSPPGMDASAASFEYSWATSTGNLRNRNEDSIFCLETDTCNDGKQLPLGIFIVADGMGGHLDGSLASGKAISATSRYLLQNLVIPMQNGDEINMSSIQDLLEKSVHEAQSLVQDVVPGGGTTMVIALVIGEVLTVANVGDSRLYLIQADSMEQLTHDHSVVQRRVDIGQLSREEALVHPQRNVLYRAIGQIDQVTPDFITIQVPERSRILLCSDGLWGEISDQEIFDTIAGMADLRAACMTLVEQANLKGGADNISVILIGFY